MSTICWTILRRTAGPVARSAAQAARHHAGPIHHHAARVLHHGASSVASPHTWLEVVCRAVPAAIVSGSVLAPHLVNPPRLPEPPPPIVQPAPSTVQPAPPTTPLLLPPGSPSFVSPYPAPVTPTTGTTPTSPAILVPEPSSAGVLLLGALGLLLVRVFSRRKPARSRRAQPEAASQARA